MADQAIDSQCDTIRSHGPRSEEFRIIISFDACRYVRVQNTDVTWRLEVVFKKSSLRFAGGQN